MRISDWSSDVCSSDLVKQLDRVIIRFAGDSGDGMQLTGDRFTQESAVFGNDLVTLPNFPAEIRAPQGTIPGVSSFQVHFADPIGRASCRVRGCQYVLI